MDNFLENRAAYIVQGSMSSVAISRIQSKMQYNALMVKATSLIEEIVSSADFMDEEISNVISAAEDAIFNLENRVEHIRDSNRTLNRAKLEVSSIATDSDISIINLGKGEFTNMAFSVTDKGIVLNSKVATIRREVK